MNHGIKVFIIVLVLVGVTGGFIGWRFYQRSQIETAQSIEDLQEETGLPVRVHVVAMENVVQSVAISGSIEAWQDVVIAPQVSERINAFHVTTGEKVKKGQTLVTLDNITAKLQLELAQAQHKQAQQNLEKLRNGSRPEEIESAMAQMEQAQAMANLARIEYERQQNLYDKDATTLQIMQRAENEWKSAAAAQQGATAAYELVKKGPRDEDIRMAETQVALAEVAARQAQDQLDKLTLYAPCDGVVTVRMFEVGDVVDFNQMIFRVLDMDRVYLVIDASEIYLSHLKMGLEVNATVDALPEQTFTGKVDQIDPGANPMDRTFKVKIAFDNAGHILKPGMFARAHINTSELKNVFPVPADVVRHDDQTNEYYVLAVDDSDVVHQIEVKVSPQISGNLRIITDGINAGMQLITLADESVMEGTKVTITSNNISPEVQP